MITIEAMFYNTPNFTNGGQSLGWTTQLANVTNFSNVFNLATAFNQDVSGWDISSAQTLERMFLGATGLLTTVELHLIGAQNFNVTTFSQTFESAVNFNQDVSGWDLSSATTLSAMF